MSVSMKAPASRVSGIDQLRQEFSGVLIVPTDAQYDAARAVWNGMIDKYPALIARCTCIADVVAAVNFAREQQLVIAVRGGGHNVAGYATCDGGIVIDLSPMKEIQRRPCGAYRPCPRRVRPGAIWMLQRKSTAWLLQAASVSDTGIAGLTLGGGYGWLRSKYGLSCDNLIAAEVVTADGRVVHADEQREP